MFKLSLFVFFLTPRAGGMAPVHEVGTFESLEACRQAAEEAVLIDRAPTAPDFGFICVRTKSG